MAKSFSLTSIVPKISSVTKSDVSAKVTHKRATGKVLMIRPAAGRAGAKSAARSRSRSRGRSLFRSSAWVSTASAAGLACLVALFGLYIYTINAYSAKGYELKKQQAAMADLEETHKQLMIKQASSGSILRINDVASAAKMVPVTGEEFLVANQLSTR